jgi:hypothetical protein
VAGEPQAPDVPAMKVADMFKPALAQPRDNWSAYAAGLRGSAQTDGNGRYPDGEPGHQVCAGCGVRLDRRTRSRMNPYSDYCSEC